MTEPTPHERQELISFVRERLGCGCPDEVFADIRIERNPDSFLGLPIDHLVSIGGRLLVVVSVSSRWNDVLGSLEKMLEAGTNLRDCGGFNRFRLVVTSDDPEAATPALQGRLTSHSGPDEKVHLHAIRPSMLPRCLS